MITLEKFTELAHRTASRYSHRSEPARAFYTFSPETLADFHRQVFAAVDRSSLEAVPEDGFAVNFVVHAGIDKQTARKCEKIVRDLLSAAPAQPAQQKCWRKTCRPITLDDMRMVTCPDCGNKRCPKANDHRNACTNSNEPGQPGSAYPAPADEAAPTRRSDARDEPDGGCRNLRRQPGSSNPPCNRPGCCFYRPIS